MTTLPNRRILVVDDNPAIQDDFCKILTLGVPRNECLDGAEVSLFGEPTAPCRSCASRSIRPFKARRLW